MDHLEALILGVVQGLTEFLPVSSSAHLTLAKRLLGIAPGEGAVAFDLMCHLGTLAAIFIALRNEVFKVLTQPKAIALYFLALIPLIPAYILLKPLRPLLSEHTGFFLLCTSLILFASSKTATLTARKWRDVLCIGVAQSMALLPGISRSGSTMSMARWLGWQWQDAAVFSFLLAVPTILGGTLLEALKGDLLSPQLNWSVCMVGCVTSLIVGLFAIRLLFWMLERGTLRPFAWYCLAVGLLAIVFT